MSTGPEAPQGSPPGNAAEKVNGPAIGLIVTAVIGIVLCVLSVLMNLLGVGMAGAQAQQLPEGVDAEQFQAFQMFSGGLGIVTALIGIVVGVVIFMGAQKMKRLESHGFAMTASILAMIPCLSPCCIIGLPIGIWALVVLMNDEVKSAFRS